MMDEYDLMELQCTIQQAVEHALERSAVPRRERIAVACLAGMLADPSVVNAVQAVPAALIFADALIAALDAPVTP